MITRRLINFRNTNEFARIEVRPKNAGVQWVSCNKKAEQKIQEVRMAHYTTFSTSQGIFLEGYLSTIAALQGTLRNTSPATTSGSMTLSNSKDLQHRTVFFEPNKPCGLVDDDKDPFREPTFEEFHAELARREKALQNRLKKRRKKL